MGGNSKIFHLVTKLRRAKNKIIKIIAEDGSNIVGQQKLENFSVSHLNESFSVAGDQSLNVWYWDIPRNCISEDNSRLNSLPSEAEIFQTLKSMSPSHGPDTAVRSHSY